MSHEIRIVIADDHPIVRKGLCQVIGAEPDLIIVGEAGDGEAGLSLIQKLQPHMAVLDLDMPKLDGFGIAREIRTRNLTVKPIFLTYHDEVDLLHRALELGGKAFILKESALIEIVSAVRAVAAGKSYVSPSLTEALLQRQTRAHVFELKTPALAGLTPSERRILGMIASGQSSKEIAAELHIHYRTVETHRASICQKLNLKGANTLLRFALEHKSELVS